MNPTLACDLAFLHVHGASKVCVGRRGKPACGTRSTTAPRARDGVSPTPPSRSHLLGGVDAEQAEAVGERARRQRR